MFIICLCISLFLFVCLVYAKKKKSIILISGTCDIYVVKSYGESLFISTVIL